MGQYTKGSLRDTEITFCKNQQRNIDKRKWAIKFKDNIDVTDLASIMRKLFVSKRSTYYENGKKQCDSNRQRSIQDLTILCKTYIGDIPFEKLWGIVNDMRHDNIFGTHFCNTVRKDVFYPISAIVDYKTIANYLERIGFNPKCTKINNK